MREYVLLMTCLIVLSACSSEKHIDFDKTMIVTGKVIQKSEEREKGRATYHIEILTIVDQTKKNIILEVKNRNVWNLIRKGQFYRISFDTKEADRYKVNSPIQTIKPIKVDNNLFQENVSNPN
ncbi:DUF3221 domain-containing protein [Pontibacillus yanchengensis]|uniref:DUF3221 domain-containing protein n=1 Tax=Pontibacillus yanchengensis TaxID=462910 RepID=A0A6I5A439_9BACI|nr:DUF3221 domain-containing protein [Pontibacillus yanchengensis]